MTTPQDFLWECDLFVKPLIIRLKTENNIESKDFLKPIFRWLKQSGSYYNPEKAFMFINWMINLQTNGDVRLELSPRPNIQIKYALNVIVTMGQRYNIPSSSIRAYEFMLEKSIEPDVFTYTALMVFLFSIYIIYLCSVITFFVVARTLLAGMWV